MSYRWRYQDETGSEIPGPDQEFPSKSDAESWFATEWLQLRHIGVKTVTLLEDGNQVSGPMELEEA
jgi:hypothetical protein